MEAPQFWQIHEFIDLHMYAASLGSDLARHHTLLDRKTGHILRLPRNPHTIDITLKGMRISASW